MVFIIIAWKFCLTQKFFVEDKQVEIIDGPDLDCKEDVAAIPNHCSLVQYEALWPGIKILWTHSQLTSEKTK